MLRAIDPKRPPRGSGAEPPEEIFAQQSYVGIIIGMKKQDAHAFTRRFCSKKAR
jgi:hypothetical protein